MKTYCQSKTHMGQGDNAVCGESYYGEIYQCDKCKLKDAQRLLKLYMSLVIDEECYSFLDRLHETNRGWMFNQGKFVQMSPEDYKILINLESEIDKERAGK